MESCCDNKNIIFTDYYVCTNCGVIHGYRGVNFKLTPLNFKLTPL